MRVITALTENNEMSKSFHSPAVTITHSERGRIDSYFVSEMSNCWSPSVTLASFCGFMITRANECDWYYLLYCSLLYSVSEFGEFLGLEWFMNFIVRWNILRSQCFARLYEGSFFYWALITQCIMSEKNATLIICKCCYCFYVSPFL